MVAAFDRKAIEVLFEKPQSDGSFVGETLAYFRTLGCRKPILLLAFAPKAAGTFFRQAACEAVGGYLFRMTHAQGGRDASPYLPTFITCYLDPQAPPIISHMHMQALAANRNFIEAFAIKPVIMIRSIPDMLVSYSDMLDVDPIARAEGLNCRISDDFVDKNRQAKSDFMIDMVAPWYVSYFATWKSFHCDAQQTVCVLHYDAFCDSPAETLHTAITHSGMVVTRAKCDAAVASVWNKRRALRFNHGVAGRGRDYFNAEQLSRLKRMLSHYPELAPWQGELMGEEQVELRHVS